jgi:hypothetical protein
MIPLVGDQRGLFQALKCLEIQKQEHLLQKKWLCLCSGFVSRLSSKAMYSLFNDGNFLASRFNPLSKLGMVFIL